MIPGACEGSCGRRDQMAMVVLGLITDGRGRLGSVGDAGLSPGGGVGPELGLELEMVPI